MPATVTHKDWSLLVTYLRCTWKDQSFLILRWLQRSVPFSGSETFKNIYILSHCLPWHIVHRILLLLKLWVTFFLGNSTESNKLSETRKFNKVITKMCIKTRSKTPTPFLIPFPHVFLLILIYSQPLPSQRKKKKSHDSQPRQKQYLFLTRSRDQSDSHFRSNNNEHQYCETRKYPSLPLLDKSGFLMKDLFFPIPCPQTHPPENKDLKDITFGIQTASSFIS